MRQKAIPALIMMAILAAPSSAATAGRGAPTADEIKVRAAAARSEGREVVVKLRAGAKILIGEKELPFEFMRRASLSGKIKEVREKDFTLAQKDGRAGEITTVVSYDDVLSVKRPSGFKKALKNVGKYSLGGAAVPVVLPLYGVMALLGRLPDS